MGQNQSTIKGAGRARTPLKIDKIYTRTGDDGKTSLGDGKRLPKDHARVAAMGGVDEANAALGVAILHMDDAGVREHLRRIQNDLFDVGADLALPGRPNEETKPLRISEEQVSRLEHEIDAYNADLAPLDSFVLPGGSEASAYLHLARTVARRAERDMVRLASEEALNPNLIRYVNRLSDLLFVLARFLNGKGKDDVRWVPGRNR